MQSQTAELVSFCMTGWQVCKPDICTPLRKDVREGLLKNASFMKIGPVVASLESAVAQMRQAYNDAAVVYNNTCQVFPNSVVASMSSFEPREYFEVRDAEIREAPKVSF